MNKHRELKLLNTLIRNGVAKLIARRGYVTYAQILAELSLHPREGKKAIQALLKQRLIVPCVECSTWPYLRSLRRVPPKAFKHPECYVWALR